MFPKIKNSTWTDLPLREYIYLSAAIDAVLALTLFLAKNLIPPVVPLFYGSAAGESQIVPSIGLYIAPGASFLILTLNSLIAGLIGNIFLKKILIISTFLFTVFMTITTLKIIFLVGFF